MEFRGLLANVGMNMWLIGKILVGTYFGLLLLLSVYGFHRYMYMFLYYTHRKDRKIPKGFFKELPVVTIQLPMYNELYVAQRLIRATCAIDYPREKMEIQILDDSTDETTQLVTREAEALHKEGFDIRVLHRADRSGYKAGALAEGLKVARGEFVAIFDADFIPPTDWLNQVIHYFTDEKVGLVQSRWGHINRDYSVLTQIEAIMLDGHFIMEHTARNRSGRFFNFNGTAGIWRMKTIDACGGWSPDTLTEDLDISFRAQLAGWQFVYVPEVVAPAELPVEMNALKTQQHRWAKGYVQTGLKLLPKIWKAKIALKIKIEATLQLTNHFAYLMILILCLLMLPALLIRGELGWQRLYVLDIIVFMAATFSVGIFYMASEREVSGKWMKYLKYIPMLMSVGIGLSITNTRGIIEAILGRKTEFVRTPKYSIQDREKSWKTTKYLGRKNIITVLELILGFYFLVVVGVAWEYKMYASIPFLLLFPLGFFYASLLSIFQRKIGLAK